MSPRTSRSSTSTISAGRVLSSLALIGGALVVLSGCLPLGWMRYQDYEAARQILQWDAPFRPNMRLRTRYFVGDEADEGNVAPTEQLPERSFTTDRLGFRYTPPEIPGRPIELVVFRGFSFTFGAGLSDDETLPARLSRELHVNAYNAGRFHEDPEGPEDFDRLMAAVGARPKVAVYVHLEPNGHTGEEHPRPVQRILRFAKELPMNWIRSSPLIRYSGGAKKLVQDDRFLHNRYRDHLRSWLLPRGEQFLVLDHEMEPDVTVYDDSVVSSRADYVAWWRDRLAERGIQTVVLLVPDKLSVYGAWLGVKLPDEPYLNRLERQLQRRGLNVVNGLHVFRGYAESDLQSGRMSYMREDHHWSVLGVERASRATAEAIRRVQDEHAAPTLSRAH